MTMAPGQRKRSFWLEFFFISILIFLLMGARSQRMRHDGSLSRFSGSDVSRTIFAAPAPEK